MTPAARVQAAIEVLDAYLSGRTLEQCLSQWARAHRFAGSKDRAALRDLVFDAVRRRASYAWLGGGLTGRGLMLGKHVADGTPLDQVFNGTGYGPSEITGGELKGLGTTADMPIHVSLDVPEWLFQELRREYGDTAIAACRALQSRAPVDLRVNLARTTPEKARSLLSEDGVLAEPLAEVATALRVSEGARKVARTRAFLNGHVELQDAASQLSVLEAPVPQGGRILDYCAGGGGKALALAARSGASVHVHDAAPARMRDLPARAQRAGVSLPLWTPEDPEPFDLVFCDAPCSGSGTWRRTPEAKWRLDAARLGELHVLQCSILGEAARSVKPGGHLVYATCALLASENQDQISRFCTDVPGFSLVQQRQLMPESPGDGFFFAVLKRV